MRQLEKRERESAPPSPDDLLRIASHCLVISRIADGKPFIVARAKSWPVTLRDSRALLPLLQRSRKNRGELRKEIERPIDRASERASQPASEPVGSRPSKPKTKREASVAKGRGML